MDLAQPVGGYVRPVRAHDVAVVSGAYAKVEVRRAAEIDEITTEIDSIRASEGLNELLLKASLASREARHQRYPNALPQPWSLVSRAPRSWWLRRKHDPIHQRGGVQACG